MAQDQTHAILILDDDPYIRSVVCTEMEAEGHLVWSTPDAKAALVLIEAHDFDVILFEQTATVRGEALALRLRQAGYKRPMALFTATTDATSRMFPIIDKNWPMQTMLSAIGDVVNGRDVTVDRINKLHRYEAIQQRRTTAANLDAAAKAAQTTFAAVAQEPLPATVTSMLERLKTKLGGA